MKSILTIILLVLAIWLLTEGFKFCIDGSCHEITIHRLK